MLSTLYCLLVLPMALANHIYPRDKIITGSPAGICEFPSIVHIIIQNSNKRFSCGGTLIDNQHVLSSAHCFGPEIRSVKVNIGTNRNDRAGKFLVTAESFSVHEGFTKKPISNDIVMVKLSKPVVFSGCVKPSKLAKPGQTFEDKSCIVAGWGKQGIKLPSTKVLQKASMPIIHHAYCARKMFYANINDQHICAGDFVRRGLSSCLADSGGPLYCPDDDGNLVLAGITSFAHDCSVDAAVFTSVSTFRKWIDENH